MLLLAVVTAAVIACSLFYLATRSSRRPSASVEAVPPSQGLRGITAAEVALHNREDDCWLIIDGKVFDVTPFVDAHPGGSAIYAHAGQDVSKGFHGPQHPLGAFDLVEEYQIGVLQTL